MDVASQIRRTAEQRPYPRVKGGPARACNWQLAPMAWISTVWQPTKPLPERILVAGCGTGAEAFVLRRKFPAAKITAVDFSPRSIQIARASQRATRTTPPIRFMVGDLSSRGFTRAVGRDFDFVTCHGVLSYIPNVARALANLARCLAPDGALFLGVNGAAHFSTSWRRALQAFGYDLNEFSDRPRLRAVLKLCDVLSGNVPGLIARQEPAFLAGDLFGSLNHTLPLARWNQLARRAGLHGCGSFEILDAMRPILNGNLGKWLMPRSRSEVAELLDWLNPASFHRLIFKRNAPDHPPWPDARAMLDWRPQWTPLYLRRWSKSKSSGHRSVRLELRSPATNALVEMQVPGWELACLKLCDGTRSLRQIFASLSISPPVRPLLDEFYLLHQFAVLNLLAPLPARPSG